MTNGNQLTLIAGGEIIVENADLPPNVDLIIGYPSLCEGAFPPAVTGTDLNAFCTGGDYNPVGQLLDDPDLRESLNQDQTDNTSFDLVALPNPFNNFIDLRYSNFETEFAEIIITDGMGRTLAYMETELNEGENQRLRIETADWANGFYMLTLKTENVIKTIKVIKQ